MADEKYLEFLLLKRSSVFSKGITKSSFSSLSFQKNRKRRRIYKLLIIASVLACNTIERRFWTLARTDQWFQIVETAFTDKEWYDNFRVSKTTFEYIVSQIEDEIGRQDTSMRKAISPRKRTAITLYYMSSTAEYRTIANLFGVSKSFVCLCIKDVCKAITKKLKKDFLSIPKGEDLSEVMKLYKEKWGFPSCAGAIDGTHIPIQAPLENRTDYINRKSYHSIVLQAMVDSKYLFRDVVIGWPGSVHDARVLSNSEIYNRGCNGDLFDPNIKETILGIDIAPVILGDPAYPLLDWLIKAYPENQNTPNWQRHFNYRLSRARMTVEDTFGRWKGRFRRVLKRVDMAVDSTCYLVVASCILHNICELKRDAFLEEWLEDIQNAVEQPNIIPLAIIERQTETDAANIRDALALFFRTPEGRHIGRGGE